MNIRITDLLDQYEDQTVKLTAQREDGSRHGSAPVRARRRRFGWKEALTAAAAVAVIVLCAALLRQGLARTQSGPLSGPENVSPAPSEQTQTEPLTEPTATPAPESEAPASEAPAPEPDGWEEEYPQEYPVEAWRLEGGAAKVFAQTGSLNKYRYAALPGAEAYVSILGEYAAGQLSVQTDFVPDLETAHDGYCNWFMEAGEQSASVSGSSVTGRFSFYLWPGTARAEAMAEADPLDADLLVEAATSFADEFEALTGPLEFIGSKVNYDQYYPGRADTPDIRVRTLTCFFRSPAYSEVTAQMQAGYDVPVLCGDSEIEDPARQLFTVTLWPDGTVVYANNYLTRAALEPDGATPMLTEANLPQLLSFFTSFAEHDTMVIRTITADCYNVYFGSAQAEQTISVTYYYESDPDTIQTTQIIAEGLLDEAP